MAIINILSKDVYNKISAGEVVERPASIVKELFENSVDAGATEITIGIENGGINSIFIQDNGSGIEKSELEKVFMPHPHPLTPLPQNANTSEASPASLSFAALLLH